MLEEVFIEVLVFAICIQLTITPLSNQYNPFKLHGRSCLFTLWNFVLRVILSILKVAFISDVLASFDLKVPALNLVVFASQAKSKSCLRTWISSPLLLVSSKVEISPSLLTPASKLWHKILVINSEVSGCVFWRSQIPDIMRGSSRILIQTRLIQNHVSVSSSRSIS